MPPCNFDMAPAHALMFGLVLITVACATATVAAGQVKAVPVEQEEVSQALLLWWHHISSSIWHLANVQHASLLLVLVAVIVWVAMLGHCGYNSPRKRRRRGATGIVPFATMNVLEVVRGMTSDHPHTYLLDLARRCQNKTFRLPLPIFRVVQLRWGRRQYFYLPLPTLRRVFVVGDVPTARRILQDASSDKPPEIYTSFEGITNAPVMFTSRNSGYTRSVRRSAHRAFSMKTK